MSWLPSAAPELILAWHDHAYIFRLDRDAAFDGKPQVAHSSDHDHVVLHHACVALTFLSERVVTLVDYHGGLAAVDPRAPRAYDHTPMKLSPSAVAAGKDGLGKDGRSCRQAVTRFVQPAPRPGAAPAVEMWVLCRQPAKMVRVEVMTWLPRLERLSPSREALALAADMKHGTAVFLLGLPGDGAARDEQLRPEIGRLLQHYMAAQIEDGDVDDEAWWVALGRDMLHYLCKLDLRRLIFSTVFDHFAELDRVHVWATLLEPLVMAGTVRGLPKPHLALVAEWLTRGAVLAYHYPHQLHLGGKDGQPPHDVQYTSALTAPRGAHQALGDTIPCIPDAFTVDLWARPRGVTADGHALPEQCVACSADCYNRTGWSLWLEGTVWMLKIGDGAQFADVYDVDDEAFEAQAMRWTRLTVSCDMTGEVRFFINQKLVPQECVIDYVPMGRHPPEAEGAEEAAPMPSRYPLRIGAFVRETAPGSGMMERASESKPFMGDVRGFKLYATAHAQELFDEVEGLYDVASTDSSDDNDNDEGEEGRTPAPALTKTRLSMQGLPASPPAPMEIVGVEAAVSETASTASRGSAGGLHAAGRLEGLLLQLGREEMAAVGGDYAVVEELAEEYYMYKAYASYLNRVQPGAAGYNAPLLGLYNYHREPMVGSVVEYSSQRGQGGLTGVVESKEDGKYVMVRWTTEGGEAEEETGGGEAVRVAAAEVAPVAESPPNRKARKVLLRYLKALFLGQTFHGEPVPRGQLLEVKVQALEFLFFSEGQEKNVTARRYPVLEELLDTEARGVILALHAAFYDEHHALSPWKRILTHKATAKTGALTDAANPQTRFRLSRDQIAAILLKKMNASEFGPLEPKLTFARAKPQAGELIALFELVAHSIARRCVQVRKFSTDAIKRIVSHLAYQCPEATKVSVQQCLEAMLVVALDPANECWAADPSEHDIADLRKIAQEAGFLLLQIYLYRRSGNYSVVLRTYLKACLSDRELDKESLFSFLDETLESMNGDPSQAAHQEALQAALLDHLEELIKVDSSQAANIIVRHLHFKHKDIMYRLDKDSATQYAYLKGIIDASETKSGGSTDIWKEKSTFDKYIRLLWHYDEASLLPFVKKYEANIEIQNILHTVERLKGETEKERAARDRERKDSSGGSGDEDVTEGDGREDVSVYLYSRMGRYTEALDLLLRRLRRTMVFVRCHLLKQIKKELFAAPGGWGRRADVIGRNPSAIGGRAMKFQALLAFRSASSHRSRIASAVSDQPGDSGQLAAVLESRDGRTVADLIGLGVDICKVSMRAGVADTSAVWFSLLAKFIKPKKILSEIEAMSRKLYKFDVVVSCVALAAAVASEIHEGGPDDAEQAAAPFGEFAFTSFSAVAKLNTRKDELNIIDELAEVDMEAKDAARQQQARTQAHARAWSRAQRPVQRKLLEQSLSPPLLVLNQRMQQLYAHYINTILVQMMATHQAQASHDKDMAEIDTLRREVNRLGREHGVEHARYKEERGKLSAATERIEMVVLNKVTEEHSDSTFNEFKTVLTGILEALRTERTMQSVFYNVLSRDVHGLAQKLISAHQAAAYLRAEGLPPWPPVCGVCGTRLHERSTSTAFKCNHAFHRQCLKRPGEAQRSDACVLCISKKLRLNAAAAAPPSQPAADGAKDGATSPKGSAKAVRMTLDRLARPQLNRLASFQQSLKVTAQPKEPEQAVQAASVHRLSVAPVKWCVDEADGLDAEELPFDFEFEAPDPAPAGPAHTERMAAVRIGKRPKRASGGADGAGASSSLSSMTSSCSSVSSLSSDQSCQ
eukprot:TRINITY_DN15409_c0_g1_i1.p1 TRINITY_DN15409_c0_g1~~TRINITY_DN15409_c0_g1_i1.p1  ORF type:complete len:2016 (+),score=798.79 TRINITY_DN15409_c0_g1_i1:673-6048(+)